MEEHNGRVGEAILEELRKINAQLGQISRHLMRNVGVGEAMAPPSPAFDVRSEIERVRAEMKGKFGDLSLGQIR